MEKIRIGDVNNSDSGSGINISDPQHCFHPSPYLIGCRTNHPLSESQVAFRTIIEDFLYLGILVDLRPMAHEGSRRMSLDPDVVPPLAGFRLYANLGVILHALSVPFVPVFIFETAHCF